MEAKEAPGRELKDHENRSGTTVHGWPSVLVGLVAAASGAPALLAALGYLAPDSASGAPGFVLGIAGGIFVLVGFSFVAHGLAGLRRKMRVERGRERKDHENRSGTTVHGWPSVLVGLIAAAAGVPAILVALGYLDADSTSNAPGFVLGVVGGIFALVGLSFVAHGLAGLRRKMRVERGRERHPREPWRWDHRWDERGARDDSARQLALWAGRAVGFGLFSVPFNWLVFFSGELPWWGLVGFGLGTGLVDLLVLYVVYRFVRALARLLRYGPGSLRYGRFPFFLGETLDVTFEPTGRMEGMGELTATLRCVEERYEARGRGENRSSAVIGYEVYSATKGVEVPAGSIGQALGASLSFPLPEASLAPPTSLGERPPVYWELEVKAEAPGVDYGATFLVPVYAR